MSRCGESAVNEISDPGLLERNGVSVGAQYLSSRVFLTESRSSGGPGCVCFRFYRLFFKARTFFGFELNYNLLPNLQYLVMVL